MKGKYGKQKQNLVWRVFRGSEEIAKTHDLEEADCLRTYNDGRDASIRVGPSVNNTITVWSQQNADDNRSSDPGHADYGRYECDMDAVFDRIAKETESRAKRVYSTHIHSTSDREVKLCNFLLNQF